MILNAIAAFVLFTVSHEASHHSASCDGRINTWLGRLSTPFFAPHAGFRMWRFIHMQHHRFTNHADGSDPDHFTHRGARWTAAAALADDRPLVHRLLPPEDAHAAARGDPRGARHVGVLIAIAVLAIVNGLGVELLLLYFLPIRIAVFVLGWAFDYLPAQRADGDPRGGPVPRDAQPHRAGASALPLLLYQNYHLVHHLHPVVPFYRYIAVWRRSEEAYLAHDPALSDVRGRPLTVDEYRRLRELQEHH